MDVPIPSGDSAFPYLSGPLKCSLNKRWVHISFKCWHNHAMPLGPLLWQPHDCLPPYMLLFLLHRYSLCSFFVWYRSLPLLENHLWHFLHFCLPEWNSRMWRSSVDFWVNRLLQPRHKHTWSVNLRNYSNKIIVHSILLKEIIFDQLASVVVSVVFVISHRSPGIKLLLADPAFVLWVGILTRFDLLSRHKHGPFAKWTPTEARLVQKCVEIW